MQEYRGASLTFYLFLFPPPRMLIFKGTSKSSFWLPSLIWLD